MPWNTFLAPWNPFRAMRNRLPAVWNEFQAVWNRVAMDPVETGMNRAAPVAVHTPGGYTSIKEIRMNTTTQNTKAITLGIDGMSCGHCVQAVTKVLSAVPGVKVKSVAVGSAVIETADGWTTGKAVAALQKAGYSAKAVGETTAAAAPMAAQAGGGCCGGARRSPSDGTAGTKASGGCCG